MTSSIGSHTTAAEELAAAGRWEAACQHLRAAVRLPCEQSRQDSLTASYNRRYFDERLAGLLDNPVSRGIDGIAVALVDADRFEQVNDSYGHQLGDRVLQRIVAEPGDGAADMLRYAAKHSGRNAVAFRDPESGLVWLAGPAGGRRDVNQALRVPRPGCDRCGSAP